MLPVTSRPLDLARPAPRAASPAVAAPRSVATPDKPGQSNESYDGHLVGGDGNAYPPSTRLEDVPPVRPQSGAGRGTLVFVNGMGETRASDAAQLQRVANGTGMNVVGVYNATEGTLKDLVQCLKDKLDLGTNKAVDSLADLVYSKVKAGEPVRVMAHSQGALITQRALQDVQNRLMVEDGMTRAEAQRAMSKVGVETFGGAGSSFVDGPKYVHYVNRSDIVPMAFGVGAPGSHPGAGAKVVAFGWLNPFGGLFGGKAHDTSTYFEHYKPFPA